MSAESARVVSARGPVAGRWEKRERADELMVPIGNVRRTSESVAQAEGFGVAGIFFDAFSRKGGPLCTGNPVRFGPFRAARNNSRSELPRICRGRPRPSGAGPELLRSRSASERFLSASLCKRILPIDFPLWDFPGFSWKNFFRIFRKKNHFLDLPGK